MITTLSPSAPSGVCACPPSSNLGALTLGRRPPGSSMQILPAPPRCLNRVPNRLICASSRPQLTQPSGAPSRRSRTTTPVGVGHVMLSVLVTRRAREPPICSTSGWQVHARRRRRIGRYGHRRGRVSPLRGRRGVAGDWADGKVPVHAGQAAARRSRWCGALLGDRVAAVHDQVLPGDVGRAGAGQPGNCGGDLVG